MKIGINLHQRLLLVIYRSSSRIKFLVAIVVFLMTFPVNSYSKNFYFSSSTGNDSNTTTQAQNPATPWKTIDQLNRSMNLINAGDFILFKRGDTFYGTIKVTRSGLSGSPIIIGAYGIGDNPIITGFTTISGWTNEGNGIYSKVLLSEVQTNMVTIDGVNIGMGRYPKLTFLNYESFATNVSITDNGLGDATDWAGAEVAIRKNDWTLDRCLITDHSGDKLTYSSLGSTQNATANFGYFIQNDLRCVTKYGDWYHDTKNGKFYMYFGAVDPSTKTVRVATLSSLINVSGYQYLTMENITFTGSISNIVNYNWAANHCVIQNCNLTFAGSDGIRLFGDYGTIENNQITDCYGYGIYSYGTNAVITNNTLKNISIIEGQSKGWLQYVGIFVEKNDCLVYNNRIENIGYNGIALGASANNIELKNNFINNPCLILNDGGGIYLSGTHSSIIIDGNIILNAFGNTKGTTNAKFMAEGIYLDENANHITVINNTVANCSNSGIKLHKAHDNTVESNTAFNNFGGINFENWTGSNAIYNNTLKNNIFFAKGSSQYSLRYSSAANDILSFGIADYNYYARPIDDDDVFNTYQASGGSKNLNLLEWQSYTKQDGNSHKSAIAVADNSTIRFEYNASKASKTITLDKPMIDVKGTKYVNSILLLPFTSIVLMVDPNPSVTPAKPLFVSSAIENGTPSQLEITYNLNLANIVPVVTAFIVLVNSTSRAVSLVNISGTKVLLSISSPVIYGDIVTFSYTEPASNAVQSTAGGNAASIISQTVSNKVNAVVTPPVVTPPIVTPPVETPPVVVTPVIVNTPPVVVISSPKTSYSGFVNEISAVGSYDAEKDNLNFTWSAPGTVQISSSSGETIKYLGPAVSKPIIVEFTVSVTDGKATQLKLIPVEILPYMPELEVAEMIGVEASSFQPPNYPHNIMDGNIGTMWSSVGEDQWLVIELKQLFTIHHVKLAFKPNQKIESYFDIFGSDNRETWEPILTKSASCNFSGDLQVFDFPPSKAEKEYKYVKLVGQSNSIDSWNYISEFKIFGYRHHNPSIFEKLPVKIFPNPSRGQVNIRIDEATMKPDLVRIIGLSGKVVLEDMMTPDIKEFAIQTNLIQGVYIVQLCAGKLTLFSEKLVVIN